MRIEVMHLKKIIFAVGFLITCHRVISQPINFEFDKTPMNSGFKMEGYWIWGGSMIRVDSVYHLFASRWTKRGEFPDGYRTDSEIVRATSLSPLGPFEFQEIIIGERDSAFWDSNMAHNPTLSKIGDEFVIFYIGSDFSTFQNGSRLLMRRIGYATSKSVYGPWIRSDKPLFDTDSNNPAVIIDQSGAKLLFRDAKLRVFIAEADEYRGPYRIVNDNAMPDTPLEDFFVFRSGGLYHIICEDNIGKVSGHVRWGVHLVSENGISGWRKYDPLIAYDHAIIFENDSVMRCNRRERPQLLIENKQITHLLTAVYTGKESWCQPVKLKKPIPVQ